MALVAMPDWLIYLIAALITAYPVARTLTSIKRGGRPLVGRRKRQGPAPQ